MNWLSKFFNAKNELTECNIAHRVVSENSYMSGNERFDRYYSRFDKLSVNKEKEVEKLDKLLNYVIFLNENEKINFFSLNLIPEKARESFLSDFVISCLKGDNLIDDIVNVCKKLFLSKSVADRYFSIYLNKSIQMLFEKGDIEGYKDNVSLVLQKNEEVFIEFECESIQKKSKRIYQGYRSGVNVKVAKGLWINSGNSRGYSEKIEYLEKASSGILYFTNKRVIYSSSENSFNIKINDLINIETNDGLIYIFASRKDPYIINPNLDLEPETLKVIVRWIIERNS